MPRVRRCRQAGCHTMAQFPNHYCSKHIEHEAEYLANRQRWARSHEQQYAHDYNTKTRKRNDTKINQYAFYHTREWVSLRQMVLDRDYYLCKYCQVIGKITPAKTVDHIVPIEYDEKLKDNIENLAVICPACHRLKTDWEQDFYGTGKLSNSLKNVDEINNLQLIVSMMQI